VEPIIFRQFEITSSPSKARAITEPDSIYAWSLKKITLNSEKYYYSNIFQTFKIMGLSKNHEQIQLSKTRDIAVNF
jgi:hypothetical protein